MPVQKKSGNLLNAPRIIKKGICWWKKTEEKNPKKTDAMKKEEEENWEK